MPSRPRAAACAVAALSQSVTSCYAYAPASAPRLVPGTRVAFEVNDDGRAALARALAPAITRLEGTLLSADGGQMVVALSGYSQIRGGHTQLTGDTVRLRGEHVAVVQQRQFSRRRTALAVGAALAVAVTFLASRGAFGRGTPPEDRGGDPGGNQ